MKKNRYLGIYIALQILGCLLLVPNLSWGQKTIEINFDCKEICGNGLDDDNDGFTDCADIDCIRATFQSSGISSSRSSSQCDNICYAESMAILTQIQNDPVFGKLKTVAEIYRNCTDSEWATAKKGFIPKCLWDREGITSFTFTAGVVDGIAGEVQGMVEFFSKADELLQDVNAAIIQLYAAFNPKLYNCADPCPRENLINLIQSELLCADCERETSLTNKLFIEENFKKGCELYNDREATFKKLEDAYNGAIMFMEDYEKTKALGETISTQVETIKSNLENEDPTTVHKAGSIGGVIIASFAAIPISGIKNIKQVEEILGFLKNMSKTQLDDLSLYVNRIIQDSDLFDVWLDLWKLRKCPGTGSCGFDDVLRTMFKDLDDVSLKKLADDFKANSGLIDDFVKNPNLVKAWEEIFTLNAHPSLRTNTTFLDDFAKSAAGTTILHVPSGQMVGKKIGHTFTKHGSHNTKTLTYQAVNGNTPIGQWLDDIAAEDFISRHLSQLGQGARDIPIPNSVGGIGRVFKSGTGELVEVTHIRLVPSGSGVSTAFPINDGLTSLHPLGTYVP